MFSTIISPLNHTAGNATTVTPATPTSSVPSPTNEFNCNLEYNDICGFTNDTRNAYDWKWRGDSNQPYRGPLGDHTLGSSSGKILKAKKKIKKTRKEHLTFSI